MTVIGKPFFVIKREVCQGRINCVVKRIGLFAAAIAPIEESISARSVLANSIGAPGTSAATAAAVAYLLFPVSTTKDTFLRLLNEAIRAGEMLVPTRYILVAFLLPISMATRESNTCDEVINSGAFFVNESGAAMAAVAGS